LEALQRHLDYLYGLVKHETDLVDHRPTWFWTLQGLLFAAFGIVMTAVLHPTAITGPFQKIALAQCGIRIIIGVALCVNKELSTWKNYYLPRKLIQSHEKLRTQIEDFIGIDQSPRNREISSIHCPYGFMIIWTAVRVVFIIGHFYHWLDPAAPLCEV
jgi:hypothetical protein